MNPNFKKSHWLWTESDIAPLIHAINIMGENLTGLELGVEKGDSFMTLLHNCKSLKKLYGVDSWTSYIDYLKNVPDGRPAYECNQKDSDFNKATFDIHLKYGIVEELGKEVIILHEDSMTAVNKIEDESLDFIFFDAMMSENQTYQEAMAYYPKIKKGGYFTGHDANALTQVLEPIERVKKNFNNNNELISYDNCFMFKV